MSDPARRERTVPAEDAATVVAPRPDLGGGSATPSFALPAGAPDGLPGPLGETRIGPRAFGWGERTYVMGILNVTPDSFSGDGLLPTDADATGDQGWIEVAVAEARAMASEGADLLDIGGESTRPGHAAVDADEEARRVVPVLRAVRDALPSMPLTIDTTKPSVAEAALAAGAGAINDVWGVSP